MKPAAVLVVLLCSQLALAACPQPAFTDPSRVRLAGDEVVIVTHATSIYDARLSTKPGVDDAARFAKQKRIPLVYLTDDSPRDSYFAADCEPDYQVFSADGRFRFEVPPSQVYVAGGHLEICLLDTLYDVLAAWSRQPRRNVTVTYFMDAIYSNGRSIEEEDRFYGDYRLFMNVVTYGRPGGDQWPKLTLLETLGVIGREELKYAYLQRILPNFRRALPGDYRVEVQMNDSRSRVVRRATAPNAPTLLFRFVDSAQTFMANRPARSDEG